MHYHFAHTTTTKTTTTTFTARFIAVFLPDLTTPSLVSVLCDAIHDHEQDIMANYLLVVTYTVVAHAPSHTAVDLAALRWLVDALTDKM